MNEGSHDIEKEATVPVYVEMMYIVSCCLVCMSFYYFKKWNTYIRGSVLIFIAILSPIVVVSIWQIILTKNIKLTLIYLLPMLLGVIIGVFGMFKLKMIELPFYICVMNIFITFSSVVIFINEFLSPLYFNKLNSTKELDEEEETLLLTEIGCGIFFSMISFIGTITIMLKLKGILPLHKVWIPCKSLLLLFALFFSVMLITFIVFVRSDNVKLIIFAVLLILLSIIGCISMLLDRYDIPIGINILECFSGWAMVMVGFIRQNNFIVFGGSIIGMYCIVSIHDLLESKQESLMNVILSNGHRKKEDDYQEFVDSTDIVNVTSDECSEFCLESQNICIIPNPSLFTNDGEVLLSNLIKLLQDKGKKIRIGIHPCVEVMKGFMEILLILAKIDKHLIYGLELNEKMNDNDVCIVLGDCNFTSLIHSNWKTFQVHKAFKTIVISDSIKVQQNDNDNCTVYWLKKEIDKGLEGVINYLRHKEILSELLLTKQL